MSLKYGVLLTLSLSLTLLAAPTLAGSASADGLLGVCPSPTPSGADLATALDGVKTSTEDAITDAGGATVNVKTAKLDKTYALDTGAARSRLDTVVDGTGNTVGATHTVLDKATASQYTGYLLSDKRFDADLATTLKVLNKNQVWVKASVDPDSVTDESLLDQATGMTDLGSLIKTASGDGATSHSFTCLNVGSLLTITDTPAEMPVVTHVLTLADSGALTSATATPLTSLAAAETDSLKLADPSLALPTPVISLKKFNGASAQGAMTTLKTAIVKVAQARVAALKTHKNKVAAVRKLASTSTKALDGDLKATYTPVVDGALIKVPKVSTSGNWAVQLTVPDDTLKVSSNLP